MLQLPGLGIGKLGIPPIKDPGYFDTFRMELLLDRLHNMTNTLEKVNHLNQMRGVPMNKDNSFDRIQESLEAVRGIMYNSKSSRKIDTLSNTLSGVKRIGDMQGIMTNMDQYYRCFQTKMINSYQKYKKHICNPSNLGYNKF